MKPKREKITSSGSTSTTLFCEECYFQMQEILVYLASKKLVSYIQSIYYSKEHFKSYLV